MPEEEQRPGPRSEQTTVLSAPQPEADGDGTPANGLDPHTEQLSGRNGFDPHTRPLTAPAETPAAEQGQSPEEPAEQAPDEPVAERPAAEPAPQEDTPAEPAEEPVAEERAEAPEPPAEDPEPEPVAETPARGDNPPPPNPPVQPEPLTRGLFAPIRPAEPLSPYPGPGQNAPEPVRTEPVRAEAAPEQEPTKVAPPETDAEQTDPRGIPVQTPGTPPRGLPVPPGTPPRGFTAQQPGTPARDLTAGPGTPPRGLPAQGPGTPGHGFPAQPNGAQANVSVPNGAGPNGSGPRPGTPPRGLPAQGPATPPPGFAAQQPGTPPRGVPAPPSGTSARGFEELTVRSIDGPTQSIPARAFEEVTSRVDAPTQAIPPRGRQVEQPTQSIPRPLGAGRKPSLETDTVQIPKVQGTAYLPVPPKDTEATVVTPLPPTPPGNGADAFDEGAADERRSKRKRGLIIGVAAAFGVFGLLYGVDLLLSQGNVPRGVSVAGVDVGGLDRAAAEAKLRQQIEPRLTKPVTVRAGDVEATVNPQEAGLTLDWPATLAQAGAQPLNPFTRLTSFFGTTDVGVVTKADGAKLTSALEGLRGKTDRDPVEGTVRFQSAKPVAVDPKAGQKLDIEKARGAMVASWADGKVVELPVSAAPVKSTPESVRKALEELAKPAVSGPVIVHGEGKNATVSPAAIANSLKFEVDEGGNLLPKLDNGKVIEAAKPQLAATEKPGKDATFTFEGGRPTVRESVDGRGVDWEKTLKGLPEVLRRTDNREIKAEYGDQPAKLTTEAANQLGIKEMVARFETKGFAADSGQNIRRAAEQINGAVVKPGETFSLNGRTGPRNQATGYVEAGILEHGLPGRGVGGGVSQMATTLYNAAYYAGMVDVEHKEHSNYISRYPAGREATVFQGPSGQSLIDVKFRNDSKTGIYIQTIWTPGSITVQLWGTKTYEVTSQDGQRTNVTEPNTRHVTDKPECKPSGGLQGFTITDTRHIREIATGKTKTERRTVVYKAQDKIVCGPPTP